MKIKHYFVSTALLFTGLILFNCGEELPVKSDLSGESFELINQDSVKVNYPGIADGKVTVIGYIYTHCPDICPLTTNNMRLLQNKLKKQGINGKVQFISISFDPNRDTPSVLKNYARVRKLDLANWSLLTGSEPKVKEVLKTDGVIAVVSDSSKKTGSYYIAHTDRISLLDKNKQIRAHYRGSQAPVDKMVKDIKVLIDQ